MATRAQETQVAVQIEPPMDSTPLAPLTPTETAAPCTVDGLTPRPRKKHQEVRRIYPSPCPRSNLTQSTGKVGGLGYDSSGQRGGDQETSEHTSGGLGADDTYGDEADTGGADTGYDHNYGMGTGRTVSQEEG